MTEAIAFGIDPDLWPCGLVVMNETGQIELTNATLREWLGIDPSDQCQSLRFVDILSRAGRIYFETHLRPLLLMNGHFAEISIDIERSDGTRFGVFMNGRATLINGRMINAHFCVFKNEQRHSFERELVAKRRESDEFRSLVRSSPQAIVSVDRDLIIHAWNPAAEDLFGYTEAEAIGERFDSLLVTPEDQETVADDLLHIATGETLRSEAVQLHKDGRLLHVEKSIAAINDKTQEYSGFVAIFSDISARKASEAKIQILLEEINHRSKNLLSVVQVIARQTWRLYKGADFFSAFNNRIASLTSNQDMLISSKGSNIDLESLAHAQFAHLIDPEDPQVVISGPAVHLNKSVTQAIGMAIFELVTNAAKYGALSKEAGAVTLSWKINDMPSPMLEMSWIETDGPPVIVPTRKGFGYQVTGPLLEGVTSGQTSREYATEGFRWTFKAPLDRLTQ